MDFTSAGIDTLGKLLEVASLRHQVIANNVANVNTPGFRQQLVHFEEAFAREADRDGRRDGLGLRGRFCIGSRVRFRSRIRFGRVVRVVDTLVGILR